MKDIVIRISVEGTPLTNGVDTTETNWAPLVQEDVKDEAERVLKALEEYMDGDKTSKTLNEAKLNALMWKLRRLLKGSQSERLGDTPGVTDTSPPTQIVRQGGLAPHNIHD